MSSKTLVQPVAPYHQCPCPGSARGTRPWVRCAAACGGRAPGPGFVWRHSSGQYSPRLHSFPSPEHVQNIENYQTNIMEEIIKFSLLTQKLLSTISL